MNRKATQKRAGTFGVAAQQHATADTGESSPAAEECGESPARTGRSPTSPTSPGFFELSGTESDDDDEVQPESECDDEDAEQAMQSSKLDMEAMLSPVKAPCAVCPSPVAAAEPVAAADPAPISGR